MCRHFFMSLLDYLWSNLLLNFLRQSSNSIRLSCILHHCLRRSIMSKSRLHRIWLRNQVFNSIASPINSCQSFRFSLKGRSAGWKLSLSFCFLNLSAYIDDLGAVQTCVLANNFSSESTTLRAHNVFKRLDWDWFLLADCDEILQSDFIKNFFHGTFFQNIFVVY